MQQLFADQEFSEAAEVLEMISQTPEQKMQYNARLKFQRDEAARLEQALLEGEAKGEAKGEARGLQKGELLGRIRAYQEILGIDLTSADELSTFDLTRLSELARKLHAQLSSRP